MQLMCVVYGVISYCLFSFGMFRQVQHQLCSLVMLCSSLSTISTIFQTAQPTHSIIDGHHHGGCLADGQTV